MHRRRPGQDGSSFGRFVAARRWALHRAGVQGGMTTPEWQPEVTIDEALVRRLVGEQFPEVALDRSGRSPPAGTTPCGRSTTTSPSGSRGARSHFPGAWSARFRCLPRLPASWLLPIPLPTLIGHPSEAYPWPIFGAPFLPGRETPSRAARRRPNAFGASTSARSSAPSTTRPCSPRHGVAPASTRWAAPTWRSGCHEHASDSGLARRRVCGLHPPSVERILDAALALRSPDGRARPPWRPPRPTCPRRRGRRSDRRHRLGRPVRRRPVRSTCR